MKTRLDHRGSWVQIPSGAPIFFFEFSFDAKKRSTFYRKMHFCYSYLFLSFDFQGEVPLNIENKPAD